MRVRESSFRTLRQGDFGFKIVDGLVVAHRAGFEISQYCPKEYRTIIEECMRNGWLKPIATIRDYELTREGLCV